MTHQQEFNLLNEINRNLGGQYGEICDLLSPMNERYEQTRPIIETAWTGGRPILTFTYRDQ